MNDRDEIQRLRTLVEASKLINSSIEPDAVFASILTVTQQQLGVERGTLYFVDEKRSEIWSKVAGEIGDIIRLPVGRGIAGTVAATGEHVLLHDAYHDERFDRSYDRATGYRTRSMLCTPIKNRSGKIVGVLQLLNKIGGPFGSVDLEFLDAISDHMAIAMENATFHLALVEMERMERELQLGREIQSELLPATPEGLSGVSIAALSIPCYEVGGDYYDFLQLPDDELGIVIGDVSGKGVGAALIMSSLQAALRVAAPLEDDMAMLLARLNTFVFNATHGRKYVTLFFGRYTRSSGLLQYVNAGHNPPYVVDGESVKVLATTGRPVGILPDSEYETGSITLASGTTLTLYTDGLNEATNADDDEFGNLRLAELVRDASHGDVTSMPRRVLAAITEFEAGTPPTDDKTIVVLRRTGQPSP
jgi:sigma-B regulation protein RsbU (phosphoserine phosphatase)